MIFGTPPPLHARVSDLADLFTALQRKDLLRRLAGFELKFPQIRIDILTTALEPGVDLRTYCFWIFNASQSGPIDLQANDAGGHHILFTLDAANGKANCLIGYGLEPFVGEDHLEKILASGGEDFKESRFHEGCLKSLGSLDKTLTQIHANLGRTYGFDMKEFQQQT